MTGRLPHHSSLPSSGGATTTPFSHHRHHHGATPPRALLVLPLLAIFAVTCLVFSEVEYLLPFQRLLKQYSNSPPTAMNAAARKFDYRDFWTIKEKDGGGNENDALNDTTSNDKGYRETEEDPSQPSSDVDKGGESNINSSINNKFDRIVLLGERHSGTSYTTRLLEKCFPDLAVSDFLVRYKHWFQPTPDYVVEVTNKFLKTNSHHAHVDKEDMHKIAEDWPKVAALDSPKSAFNRTLVIVMFRDPYQWLEAMRLGPHHWPNHFTMYRFPIVDGYGSNFLPWKDFLAANMTIGNGNGQYNASHLCQNAYPFGSISPCRGRADKDLYPDTVKRDYQPDLSAAPDILPFAAHNPIYELDEAAGGAPFENPLALRTAKMRHFMDIPNVWDVGGFMTLQHEEINSRGSGFFLEQVGNIVGMKPACEADPPKNQGMKELNGDWVNWISDNVDWELEGRVGYKRRPPVLVEPQEQQQQHEQQQQQEQQQQPQQAKAEPASVEVTQQGESDVAALAPKQQVTTEDTTSFDRIVLLGERHSGTSYTTHMLAKCFPSLDVSDFLVRFKHWFQPTPDYVVDVTKRYLVNGTANIGDEDMLKIAKQWPKIASLDNPKSAFRKTLVIIMARNVYDWLEAMRLGPHHWPNHQTLYRFPRAPVPEETTGNKWYGSNFLPWQSFLVANMTLGPDLNARRFNSSHLCQNAYPFSMVSPCRASKAFYPDTVKRDYVSDWNEAPDDLPFNNHFPIYEMDENGNPFANPLELRTAKLRNFMDIPNKWDVGGFMTLQHEDINSRGSAFLLEQVRKITGIEPVCEADAPKNQASKELNTDWAEWITANADWQAEGLMGYKPRAGGVGGAGKIETA